MFKSKAIPDNVFLDEVEDDDECGSGNENVIVDCDVLEASKENIQPIAGGRRVTTLASVLATPHAQRDARLAATRARLRAQVDAALTACSMDEEQDDDSEATETDQENRSDQALAAYVHFVNWTIEHYPQGHSAESGILELLEEATRVLKTRSGCRADARYLKLWVMYARYVDRPEVIYEYLLANEIGASWALLYEEYAAVLERAGRKTRADEVYLLGIARHAKPFEHLQNRHKDFQKRMMTAATPPEVQNQEPAPDTLAPTNTAPRRTVLGNVAVAGSSAPEAAGSSTTSRRTGTSRTGPVRGAPNDVFSGPSSIPNNGRRLEVFSDTDADAAPPERAPGNAWPTLDSRKTRIKENVRETEKMKGTVLKQRGEAKRLTESKKREAGAKGKLVVFSDGDEDDVDGNGTSGVGESSKAAPPKTPGSSKSRKPAFAPFEDDVAVVKPTIVPVTPKFALYTDDDDATTTATPMGTSSSNVLAPDSVMRAKPVKPGLASSEAEALRRDPFKNYPKGDQ